MELLYIDCCIRQEESRTRKLCEAFLQEAGGGWKVTHLELQKEKFEPFDRKILERRGELLCQGKMQDPFFRYAHQFAQADAVLIGAPFWDLSFPALLKVYFERINVRGITFTYKDNQCIGLCRAHWGVYLSAAGYDAGDKHLGAEYAKAFFDMLGIRQFYSICAGGLDRFGADQQSILRGKQGQVKALAHSLFI